MKKNNQLTEPTLTTDPAPGYELVGLTRADHMPIHFDGRRYDLANLTDEEAAFLLQHPEQVPYFRKLDAGNASD